MAQLRTGNSRWAAAVYREKERIQVETGVLLPMSNCNMVPGRHFDDVLDDEGEFGYDALEKAYNAAFLVCNVVDKRQRLLPGSQDTSSGEFGSSSGEMKSGKHEALDGKLEGIARIKLQELLDAERASGLNRLRNQTASVPSPSKLNSGNNLDVLASSSKSSAAWESLLSKGEESVMIRAADFHSARVHKLHVLRRLAEGCRRELVKRLKDPSETLQLQSPRRDGESHAVRTAVVSDRGGRARTILHEDNRVLMNFLASELEHFVSMMSSGVEIEVEKDSVPAYVTSLHLFRDHIKSLRDFDEDIRRLFREREVTPKLTFPSTRTHKGDEESLKNPFVNGMSPEVWNRVIASVMRTTSLEQRFDLAPKKTSTPVFEKFDRLYKRGMNGIIVASPDRGDNCRDVLDVLTGISQKAVSGPHLVVCASSVDVSMWFEMIKAQGHTVHVYPYWGDREDRSQMRHLLLRELYTCHPSDQHVVVATADAFVEDMWKFSVPQWQVVVFDHPKSITSDKIPDQHWPKLLSLRCRQRLVVCPAESQMNPRLLLQFLFPAVFSSRRRAVAWNGSIFDQNAAQKIGRVVSQVIVTAEDESVSSFSAQFVSALLRECERCVQSRMLPVAPEQSGRQMISVLSQMQKFGPSTEGDGARQPPQQVEPLKIPGSQRRHESESTPRSKKRITRCGQCVGCLSDDCMMCGHCKDMKKYGGPGLRKQSCKNRKCVSPVHWDRPSRKEKRFRGKKDDSAEPNQEKPHDDGSSDSDGFDDYHDTASVDFTSDDSDNDSEHGSIISNQLSDFDSFDSHKIFDHLDDGHSARSARSRVMRCGKCVGCQAPDCMKCRHCLDMKKYGGPGLRKQSCKSRKCVAPKMVLLNQTGKEGEREEFVDERGNVLYDEAGPSASTDLENHCQLENLIKTEALDTSYNSLTVIQQCYLGIRVMLKYRCAACPARFSTIREYHFHAKVKHDVVSSSYEDGWQQQAATHVEHPLYQLSMLLNQGKLHTNSRINAFAKIEGTNFSFFMLEPCVVLGRMSAQWQDLYRLLGYKELHGLRGGLVTCHLGNDSSIDHEHVKIAWDDANQCFMVSCLSAVSPITVNGREVTLSTAPVKLPSHSLVQVGASLFHFLLPEASDGMLTPKKRVAQLTRDEVIGWMDSAVKRRRALVQVEEQCSQQLEMHWELTSALRTAVSVNIIANDQGFRTTPCFVCFEGDQVIVGDTAVNKLHSHANNIIFHLKRVLGKNHGEVTDRDFVQEWSFKVIEGADGAAHAQAERDGEPHVVTPVEFVSIMFKNLKELAEDFTGESVEHAVISIPAHCSDEQKDLIREAAKIAGVNILSLLSEPLAAAIAYGLDENTKNSHPEYAVVFDIGGATHDVTLLNIDKGLFEVVATTGNDSLGGEDLTKALFDHCVKTFLRKTKLNVLDNKKATSRLRVACEAAKRSLSTQTQVTIEVDSLMEGEDLSLKISRSRFEELINDFVRNALKEVDNLLEEANIDKQDVDHVILIGGTSRIPLVQNSVKKYFDGKNTHLHMSPDEVVAHGATIEAAALADLVNYEEPKNPAYMVNVTPLTLSVGVANGSVVELVQRETVLPASATETFTTTADNQTEVFLQVYEGERVLTKDNTLLANLRISGITPLPKGEAEIDVTLTVSTKGVLSIVAVEKSAGSKSLEVKHDPKRLTPEDVADIIQKAEDAAEEDDAILEELEAKLAAVEVEDVAPVAGAAAPAQELD
ncbi:TPA: hypothetical protein N0F65_005987 [Lagenidium giganteum]|uniref:CXXC-type domain-containing protein n=1 Tax=Lagenidium giganteum TaxID=4803 RepID=A0AAV2ZEJ3_9STRA|nr:TPA: hypothetical protein N0F65_005987 [Lagenidium giganteum]